MWLKIMSSNVLATPCFTNTQLYNNRDFMQMGEIVQLFYIMPMKTTSHMMYIPLQLCIRARWQDNA